MGRLALIGDLHFGVKNFDLEVLHSQLLALENFANELKTRNINKIIQLGDMFDNRTIIDINFLSILSKRFKQIFKDFDFTTITGNHDMYHKADRSVVSSEMFADLLNIKVINKPEYIKFGEYTIGVSPWLCDNETLITNCDILLGHAELNGYKWDRNNLSEGVLDLDISKYKKVFMGHFHFSQDNVYIGTPYQLNFKEFCSIPGIIILNEDLTEEFIENIWSPRHFEIVINIDNVTLQYTDKVEVFNGKLPEICKYGRIIVNGKHPKVDKIIEFFSEKAEIQKIVYNYDEFLADKTIPAENTSVESLDFIKNFIESDYNELCGVLKDILEK